MQNVSTVAAVASAFSDVPNNLYYLLYIDISNPKYFHRYCYTRKKYRVTKLHMYRYFCHITIIGGSEKAAGPT